MGDAEPAFCRLAASVWRNDGAVLATEEMVVEEAPVALVYNGISHAVMMATPSHLEDFALGFSLCEGILDEARQLRDVDVVAGPQGIEVRMEIAARPFAALKLRRRTLAGPTGCGLCGVESLDQALRDFPPVTSPVRVDPAAISRAMATLPRLQALNELTHASHAAGWMPGDGALAIVREDVGRHNALDKLIGALARDGRDAAGGTILTTSRCSVEMVQKAATAGVAVLATRSAPTALAVRLADRAGLMLATWVREDRLTIMTHPWRATGATAHDA